MGSRSPKTRKSWRHEFSERRTLKEKPFLPTRSDITTGDSLDLFLYDNDSPCSVGGEVIEDFCSETPASPGDISRTGAETFPSSAWIDLFSLYGTYDKTYTGWHTIADLQAVVDEVRSHIKLSICTMLRLEDLIW